MKLFKIFTFFLFLISATHIADAQNYKYKTSRNYEIQMLGIGSDGTKVFKIFATAKNVEKAIALCKKAAVEVCIFRGLPASGSINATPALCDSKTESEKGEYFEKFFTPGGAYLNYVNITTDGVPSGQDRLKIKGGYKVGLMVQIMYDNLRQDLEKDGVIKSLNYGF